jgi:hypothetical protein
MIHTDQPVHHYGAVLEMCETRDTLLELKNAQYHAEEASILVDRSEGKPTILNVPPVIQPVVVGQVIE